jgi:Tol biopolymer transport system component
MPLSAGSRLGPYEILAPLGAGGMGEVWRGRDARLERDVAIKVLPADVAGDASRLKRFEREARAASALSHPNIVTIFDIGQTEGVSWIAMERVDGKTLRELLVSGALPTKRTLAIGAQAAAGLARAHEAGIVHRDLKPENVMVTEDGHVKILDFGLAKMGAIGSGGEEASQLPTETGTSPGVVLGTVGYMSPEQASGHALDFRSDQFALGSILYEMATGKRAFQKRTTIDTLSAILNEEPEPIAASSPQAPAPLRWIVERCLSKGPRDRYASTEDLARDLQSLRDHLSEASLPGIPITPVPARSRLRVAPAILAVAVLAALAAGFLAGRRTVRLDVPALSFHPLTFRRGTIGDARFAPDGQTIVYSAAWEGNPVQLFTTLPGAAESRPLGLPNAALRAISSRGEMAFLLRPVNVGGFQAGTLARAALAGGTPREVLDGVEYADWSPDGKELAIIRVVGTRRRLEYPPGKILYEVAASAKLAMPRFAPGGDKIAFIEAPDSTVTNGSVAVVDVSGRKKSLTRLFDRLFGLAWAPGGDEILFFAHLEGGAGASLYAVSPSAKLRLLHSSSAGLVLRDVSRDGRLLVDSIQARVGISGLPPGEQGERDLSWLEWSRAEDLSTDGRTLLFSEEGTGGGPNASVYIRRTDGSPAVRLGDGYAMALSSDGKWAITLPAEGSSYLVILPTGAGETRVVRYPGIQSILKVRCFQDNSRMLLLAKEEKRDVRLYVGDWEGKGLRPISPEGVRGLNFAVSQDGGLAAAVGPDGVPRLYSTTGGEPKSTAGLQTGDLPLRFTTDGQRLFVAQLLHASAVVYRVDLSSGRREVWKELKSNDPAGLSNSTAIQITPDGQTYAYTYLRFLDELLLIDGLR